jgi:[ribosomal protein S5]-alanine N-acetyltransferase
MDERHLESTYRWLQSADLRRRLDSLTAPTREGNAEYWRRHWADPRREDYAIVDAAERHIGNCGLSSIDLRRRKAELWIYLGEQRTSGAGGAAARALLRRGFDELGLNRVYARVLATNQPAQRFFERLGFVLEGRWREDTVVDGVFDDSLWFSLLARELPLQRDRP